MCSFLNDDWCSWEFCNNSQEELKALTDLFKCHPSHRKQCKNLNSNSWRFIVNKLKTKTTSELNDISVISVKESTSCYPEVIDLESKSDGIAVISDFGEVENVELLSGLTDPEADEVHKIAENICDYLNKEPMPGLSAKVEGKEVAAVLKAIKIRLQDEESVANLLQSLCPPVEENLLEQSKWAPALYQHIILPEILSRNSPVPRVLSSAISQLASSSPDACVQLLCMPLVLSPNAPDGPSDLTQPAIEMLTKIVAESLPPSQKVTLFRGFYKRVSAQSKVTFQEELFPLLLMLVETEGAFRGVDSEVISNLIDWLEMCSQECASSIKFTKYLVAVLKGLGQESNMHKDGNSIGLSAEAKVKLRTTVSQNKTFLKKIAQRSLEPLV